MQTIDVASWEAFEAELGNIKARLASSGVEAPSLLFRGQSCSQWRLDTTLERHSRREMSFSQYYRLIRVVQPEIEAFTGSRWELPDGPSWPIAKNACELTIGFVQSPTYSYMVHLRHHGFPSPLLDWTRSQHIAAFFAFHPRRETGKTSIYVFFETLDGGKSGWSAEPRIVGLGSTVRTHRRHFLQQSEYTICVQPDDGEWRFVPHDQVIRNSDGNQDVLWKIDIPVTERLKVLKRLDSYNLNAYSLFQSEDSLMQTLAAREFDLAN